MNKAFFNRLLISILFVTTGMVLTGTQIFAQIKDGHFQIKYGEPLKVSLNIDETEKYLSPGEIKDINLILYSGSLLNPEKILMHFDGNKWKTEFTITDTTVKMVFWGYEILSAAGDIRKTVLLNQDGIYQDAVLCDSAGVPVEGAFMERALSFAGGGSLRKENINQAEKDLQKEIGLFPDNNKARLLLYAVLLKSGKNKETVRKEIETDIEKIGKTGNAVEVKKFALKAYKLIGMGKKASEIEKELAEENPKGSAAARLQFEDAMKTKDSIERMGKFEEFIKAFPASPMKNAALSGIATAAIEVNDTVKMKEVGDELFKSAAEPSAARTLAGIAGAFSENRIQLSRAQAYITKAIDLIEKVKTTAVPPEIDKTEWQERMQITEGGYRDILGWILFLKGKKDEAVHQLAEAVKYTRQPGVYFHYGVALSNTGRKEDALKWYAKASVFGGEVSDSAYTKLVELWKYLGKPDTQLEPFVKKQAENLKTSYQKKVLSHRVIKKAPDFELDTVKDDWVVSLSDQKGSVVILCFWATWSRSSRLMINTLKNLSAKWGDSVLFLTIVTDKDIARVEKYLRDKKIWLPVLIDNKTGNDYGVRGVPTLYVIDKKGYINYVHRGFRPDIKDVLAIELNDLLK